MIAVPVGQFWAGTRGKAHLLALQTGFDAIGGNDERATGVSLTASGVCRTCAAETCLPPRPSRVTPKIAPC